MAHREGRLRINTRLYASLEPARPTHRKPGRVGCGWGRGPSKASVPSLKRTGWIGISGFWNVEFTSKVPVHPVLHYQSTHRSITIIYFGILDRISLCSSSWPGDSQALPPEYNHTQPFLGFLLCSFRSRGQERGIGLSGSRVRLVNHPGLAPNH